MKALVVPIYEEPYLIDISNKLKELQDFVLGYIECVTLSDTAVLICNEEGKLLNFTPNREYNGDIIAGDFLIVDDNGEDFCDISDADIKKYSQVFKKPDSVFLRTDDNRWQSVKASKDGEDFISYDLLQCNQDVQYKFFGLDFVKDKQLTLSLDDYHKVYHAITRPGDAITICERLYAEHNTVITDRRGHSMSVSDILVLHFSDGDRYFYTDSFGFTEITDRTR